MRRSDDDIGTDERSPAEHGERRPAVLLDIDLRLPGELTLHRLRSAHDARVEGLVRHHRPRPAVGGEGPRWVRGGGGGHVHFVIDGGPE